MGWKRQWEWVKCDTACTHTCPPLPPALWHRRNAEIAPGLSGLSILNNSLAGPRKYTAPQTELSLCSNTGISLYMDGNIHSSESLPALESISNITVQKDLDAYTRPLPISYLPRFSYIHTLSNYIQPLFIPGCAFFSVWILLVESLPAARWITFYVLYTLGNVALNEWQKNCHNGISGYSRFWMEYIIIMQLRDLTKRDALSRCREKNRHYPSVLNWL